MACNRCTARVASGVSCLVGVAWWWATQADFSLTCPAWCLHWHYRKRNLLREILQLKADILCLQEVQSDHYLDFWAPELQRAGYVAIYKKKTTEMYVDNKYAIDGCATFFRRDRCAVLH